MNTEDKNLVQGSTTLAGSIAVQAGQILGLRQVMSLPPAAREYFAQLLRSLADSIESGNGSLPGGQELGGKETESPCVDCQYRGECKEPCDKVTDFLPGITAGRGSRENTTGFHVGTLKDYEHTRRLDIFQEYESCKELFTAKQWEVICLYYSGGLAQGEIATATGKKRSAVSGLLSRAKHAKRRNAEQMRKEFVALRKGQMQNSA